MKRLNLDKCKTNDDVCKLVSKRVNEVPFIDLLNHVNKQFLFQTKAVKALYTGLSMNMNVFLSGPGGYGKSTLIKCVLDFYNIPYHSVIGYKDMPVDALLGIPNMDKLLKQSQYEINFKDSIFCKAGILIGEEFTDILPSTAAALKDILTERGFRNKDGKVESLISTMIIAANKSAEEVIDDESKKAFYDERFPIKVEVVWESYTASDYYDLLRISFPKVENGLLYFMAKLFEDNHNVHNNTISPRTAINITTAFLSKGVEFIDHFSINTEFIETIRINAEREFSKATASKLLKDLIDYLSGIDDPKELMIACLYAHKRLSGLFIGDELLAAVMEAKEKLDALMFKNNYSDSSLSHIEDIFFELTDD